MAPRMRAAQTPTLLQIIRLQRIWESKLSIVEMMMSARSLILLPKILMITLKTPFKATRIILVIPQTLLPVFSIKMILQTLQTVSPICSVTTIRQKLKTLLTMSSTKIIPQTLPCLLTTSSRMQATMLQMWVTVVVERLLLTYLVLLAKGLTYSVVVVIMPTKTQSRVIFLVITTRAMFIAVQRTAISLAIRAATVTAVRAATISLAIPQTTI